MKKIKRMIRTLQNNFTVWKMRRDIAKLIIKTKAPV